MSRFYLFTSATAPYRRAGLQFTTNRKPLKVAVDDITEDQLARLRADPRIKIDGVEEPNEAEPEKPAVDPIEDPKILAAETAAGDPGAEPGEGAATGGAGGAAAPPAPIIPPEATSGGGGAAAVPAAAAPKVKPAAAPAPKTTA